MGESDTKYRESQGVPPTGETRTASIEIPSSLATAKATEILRDPSWATVRAVGRADFFPHTHSPTGRLLAEPLPRHAGFGYLHGGELSKLIPMHLARSLPISLALPVIPLLPLVSSITACAQKADAVHDPPELILNEVMAINDQTLADPSGEFDDWVEILNRTDRELDLAGWYLSDEPEDPTRWRIPPDPGNPAATRVPAGDHALFWLDGDDEQGSRHASFRLDGGGETLLLTRPDGETEADRISLPPQHPDVAYGRATPDAADLRFLLRPTPGEPNDPTGIRILEGIEPSRGPGAFTEPFALSLATATEGGVIKFTTDGREPGLFAGHPFTEPLAVEETVSLRAAVFIGSQRVSPTMTLSYLALGPDLAGFTSNLPLVLIDARGHDFSRDTSLNATFDPSPVTSLFLQPGETGRAVLTDSPNHLGNAGLNVRGASSRAWPKQQYKLELWDDRGEDRAAPILGMPADADWILAAPYFDRSLMRNHLTFRWWEALGYASPRTRFVELFLDMDGDRKFTLADYRGIYVLTEKIKRGSDRLDLPPLEPTSPTAAAPPDLDEPFTGSYALEATNVNQHWISSRGIRLKHLEPREAELSAEAKTWIRQHFNAVETAVLTDNFTDPEAGYRQILDVPSHIDYDIMRELTRNIDGASTFFSFHPDGKIHMGPLWDYNQSFGLTSLFEPNPGWETHGWNVEYMTRGAHWMKWWGHLENHTDYQQAWEDRWVELRETQFRDDHLLGDVEAVADLLEESQVRNFERWDILGKAVWITGGGTRADPGEAERDSFAKEVSFLSDWLRARLVWIDGQVPAPPSFSPVQGSVPADTPLMIDEGSGFKRFSGTIYYTLDGTDPRAADGGLHAGAMKADGQPILLEDHVEVAARMRSIFGKWSTLRRASFLVGTAPPEPGNLTLSEIHYNPAGDDALEFIELANHGETPIDLSGLQLLEAVTFTFGQRALPPGEAVLVVEDLEAFLKQTGVNPGLVAGQWRGALNNGGETLSIQHADGRPLLSLTFDDRDGWPEAADGLGPSLELVDLKAGQLDDPASWRASAQTGGSPGRLAFSPDQGLTYTDWSAQFFEDPQAAAATADPDGDDQVNLVEFALGTDPSDAASHFRLRPLRVRTERGWQLELWQDRPAESKPAVTITAELSPDLSNWRRVPIEPVTAADGSRAFRLSEPLPETTIYARLVVEP